MINSNLNINFDILNKNYKTIEKSLEDIKINIEDLNKLVESDEWLKLYKQEDLKHLIVRLSEIDELIKIDFLDRKLEYSNYDAMKKLFILDLSEKWESEISMSSAFNTMNKIDKLEEEFTKCVLNFTSEEMHQSIVDLFDEMKYHKLRYQINIITRFQTFYKNQIKMSEYWERFKDSDVLKNIVGEEARERILTRKDLIDLTKVVPNVQDSVIPLLIFEGVAFSKVDDKDEIRYLKHNDLKSDGLHIHGNGRSHTKTRVLDLSSEVAGIVKDAINQDFIEKKVRNEQTIIELQDTEYILRASVNSRKKMNTNEDENVLSYRGAYSRLTICKEYIESMLYDIPFSPKMIEQAGKVFYVNKFINEGHGELEAIAMTLKRFGNWYKENGMRNPQNSQQINRLRKVWNLYS